MKERIWSVYTELIQLYGRVPGVLVLKLVYAATFWINILPTKYGISTTLSPRAMITGQSVKFTNHCLLDFGEYIHTHKDGDNSMESRMIKALALRPTRNIQGGHYLLNIQTRRVITRFMWNALPLPTCIHKLVQRLAWRSPLIWKFLMDFSMRSSRPNQIKKRLTRTTYLDNMMKIVTTMMTMATEAGTMANTPRKSLPISTPMTMKKRSS